MIRRLRPAVVLAAGAVGRQDRLVAISLPLLGWGAAVLLVRHGPVPDRREAAAFMVGVGVGLLVASWWCRRTAIPITGAVVTVIVGGLSFYFAYNYDVIEGWEWWAVALLAWAGFETLRSLRARD